MIFNTYDERQKHPLNRVITYRFIIVFEIFSNRVITYPFLVLIFGTILTKN